MENEGKFTVCYIAGLGVFLARLMAYYRNQKILPINWEDFTRNYANLSGFRMENITGIKSLHFRRL